MPQSLGNKTRGKNMCIALTYLGRLTVVTTRGLRAGHFVVLFSVFSYLLSLGGKTRGKNLRIALTCLAGLGLSKIETLRV